MLTIRHEFFDEIDSTNNEIKRRVKDGEEEGLAVSAGTQTAGRGRSGHAWVSPQGISIATSLLLRPAMAPERLSCLTLVAAVAVRRAIEGLYGIETMIKWPNDVIIDGKKVCGILTEMSAAAGKTDYVVVGIGVNVHQTSFDADLLDKAISIDQALRRKDPMGTQQGDCDALTRQIWQEFALLYEAFCMTEDLSIIMEEYNRFLVNRNATVRVLDPLGEWEGTARGINETGALLVETKDDLRTVDSGEVSVRGVYGYV